MGNTESPLRKTCIWCFAAVVALIPLLLFVGWYLFSSS